MLAVYELQAQQGRDLPLMVRLLIDTYRTAEHQSGRLRGELTSQEIKKYVAMCLKPDTSRQREAMNGTISQLHKGGGTNRPSDQLIDVAFITS